MTGTATLLSDFARAARVAGLAFAVLTVSVHYDPSDHDGPYSCFYQFPGHAEATQAPGAWTPEEAVEALKDALWTEQHSSHAFTNN